MEKLFKGRGVAGVLSDKCRQTAKSKHLPTSFEYYQISRREIIKMYENRDSLPVVELDIPANLHQCNYKVSGRYRFKKWNIEVYISSRNKCVENSGNDRERQYIYFPLNDTIYLCDDIYTGLKARLKTILKSNGIQIQDEDFG